MACYGRSLALAIAAPWLLGACDGGFGPEPGHDIEYLVERFQVVEEHDEWAPFPIGYLVAELALVNTRSDSLRLEYGACALELEGVGVEEGPETGIWRSQAAGGWPSSTLAACPAYAKIARLGPGDTLRPRELRRRFRLAEILADSLPAGMYAFDAVIRIGAEPARIDLGELRLPTSRFPIPEASTHRDGFRYAIEVDAEGAGHGAGASVILEVAFSAPTTVPSLERTLSASCPVRILAYREASGPTTVPVPEPAWSWPESCDAGGEPVRLGPEETRTLERAMDLEEIAARGAEPGRYYLMGVIDVDGRPIRLAAGELELGG